MRLMMVALIVALLVGSPGYADTNQRKLACENVKKQIREIEAKMRNGYTASQGIRYDERLRKLKDRRYKLCR